MMKDHTPYLERPVTQREQEQACMRELFESNIVAPQNIFEAFGGMGDTAKVLRERFPKACIHACEIDERCCDFYNGEKIFNAECHLIDVNKAIDVQNDPHWAYSLDFNRFTLMDLTRATWKKTLIDKIAERQPLWIQITDSAIRYLHLNWRYYEANDDNFKSYMKRFRSEMRKLYGYRLIAYTTYHAAAYSLWEC